MEELPFAKGDFVRIDGVIAVFFGSEFTKRESEGGEGNANPVVWVIPIDLCEDGLEPEFRDA